MAINYVRYWSAPTGALETEVAQTEVTVGSSASPVSALPQADPGETEGDWPSYNKTLTSNRFSQLKQINRTNADKLKVLCTYDTKQFTGFNSGLLEVEGALIFVTAFDIFLIDPSTCRENWRTHEDYVPATPQEVNRGAAYLDGMLFRGTQDARVLAYDFKTGNASGKPRSGTEEGRERPGCSDRLERLGFHRQRRRRHQGSRGACMRSTPRPARSCGSSTSCQRLEAI